MEESILKTVKKLLGIDADYAEFDLDILTHINTALNTLNDLGVGPTEGFYVESDNDTWAMFTGEDVNLNSVKSYLGLKVRLAFDPPATSFHITAIQEQIKELEWRMNTRREVALPPVPLIP